MGSAQLIVPSSDAVLLLEAWNQELSVGVNVSTFDGDYAINGSCMEALIVCFQIRFTKVFSSRSGWNVC